MTAQQERTVTRTYRAAIRLGEDFVTLEESITLPLGASPEEIQAAVDLGWQIYQAQQRALEAQVQQVRTAAPVAASPTIRDPDAPASDKQRSYIVALQEQLDWTSEQTAGYAAESGVDLVTMSKGQASQFIDTLKRLADERARYLAEPRAAVAEPAETVVAQKATDRQLRALARMARERQLDLDTEVQQRFGVPREALNAQQASSLIGEWQSAARAQLAQSEAAV